MPIVAIEIASTESFAEGREFDDAGPHLRLRGVARGEIDPRS
jgi:hypothetical protein